MKNSIYSFLISFLFVLPCWSDENALISIDNDFTIWPMASIEFPIYKEKLSGYIYTQPTFTNNASALNPLVLRGAVVFTPRKDLSLWTGYDRHLSINKSANFLENRIWQQAVINSRLKDFSISHRLRLEERIFDQTNQVSLRLRYRLRATHPIGQSQKWYAAGSNEVLLNAIDTDPRPIGFAENRTFIGLGRKLTKNINLEGGYQLSLINSPVGRSELMRHCLSTNLIISFPYKADK